MVVPLEMEDLDPLVTVDWVPMVMVVPLEMEDLVPLVTVEPVVTVDWVPLVAVPSMETVVVETLEIYQRIELIMKQSGELKSPNGNRKSLPDRQCDNKRDFIAETCKADYIPQTWTITKALGILEVFRPHCLQITSGLGNMKVRRNGTEVLTNNGTPKSEIIGQVVFPESLKLTEDKNSISNKGNSQSQVNSKTTGIPQSEVTSRIGNRDISQETVFKIGLPKDVKYKLPISDDLTDSDKFSVRLFLDNLPTSGSAPFLDARTHNTLKQRHFKTSRRTSTNPFRRGSTRPSWHLRQDLSKGLREGERNVLKAEY
ncbi:unnamed protein product [Cyprideis torosa]|uniref:Uncharacterized protein n=1 Tax=Cyprideis torosa TaxID=163714 RepID=A0A7R8WEM4_9CRUS|nr:unnamed protein product [Cyprideis torosa]CAG0890898.1 unnamed protein product [Cyprideis torosa]